MAGSISGSGLSSNPRAGWDQIRHEAEYRDQFDDSAAAEVAKLRREPGQPAARREGSRYS
jgi:hypothetical protein